MRQVPYTQIEALMQTRPHHDPETSTVEGLPLRDLICDALDRLPRRLRNVWVQHTIERLSYRQIGKKMRLSPPTIMRIKHEATSRLQNMLRSEPLVAQHLVPGGQNE